MRQVDTIKEMSIEEIDALSSSDIDDLNAMAIGTIGNLATALKSRKGNLAGLTRKGDKKGVRSVTFDRKKSVRIGDAFLKFLRIEHPDSPLNERFLPEDGWELSNGASLILVAKPAPKPAKTTPKPKKPAPAPVFTKPESKKAGGDEKRKRWYNRPIFGSKN